MKRSLLLLGVVALCLFAPLSAAPAVVAAQDFLEQVRARYDVPGVSAAVAVKGEIVFSAGAGRGNLELGTPIDGHSVQCIGSVSKAIAAVAVMQLVESGKIDLDAEIQTWLPWFPRKPWPITLRHILAHTSGIRHYVRTDPLETPDDVRKFRQYATFEESTRFWRDDPLLFQPGTKYSYSSYAFALLHGIIEKVTGRPLEEYLREHVWVPAKMTDSQLDVPSRVIARRLGGYTRKTKSSPWEHAVEENVSYKYTSGGMLCSDEDLCRFGHAITGGVLLKAATVALMRTPQASLSTGFPMYEKDGDGPVNYDQALGWTTFKDGGWSCYSKSGGVKGVSCYLLIYPDADVVVAIHSNGSGALKTPALQLAHYFVAAAPAR